ncbi:MAG TPA: DUF1643 domain-containing protein [Gaiellaceae bacterium]|nr:DUF1643 domain-containing protein [Gaiellaceae bacterium]
MTGGLGALFSPCRTWRYTLTREWESGGEERSCLFVCLNPSTATETEDDPTIRRCIGFAKSLGYSRLSVCNIFALRSTDPKALYEHADPVGPENLEHIGREAARHQLLVAAWGNHGELHGQGGTVMNLLRVLAEAVHVLGINATGQPKHPLYLRADTQPTQLRERGSVALRV